MAESKFLQYQDRNGDLLIDQCEELVPPGEASKCPPDCVPNPFAALPSWKSKTRDEPFFNERNCKYQITIVTPYEPTRVLPGMSDEETEQAIQNIYDEYFQLFQLNQLKQLKQLSIFQPNMFNYFNYSN